MSYRVLYCRTYKIIKKTSVIYKSHLIYKQVENLAYIWSIIKLMHYKKNKFFKQFPCRSISITYPFNFRISITNLFYDLHNLHS